MSEGKSGSVLHGADVVSGEGQTSPAVAMQVGPPGLPSLRVPLPRELGLDTSYGPVLALAALFRDRKEHKRGEVLAALNSRNVAAKAVRTLVSLGMLQRNGYLKLTDLGQRFVDSIGTDSEKAIFRDALKGYGPFSHLYSLLKARCSEDGFGVGEATDIVSKALRAQGDEVPSKLTLRATMSIFLNLARESGLLTREYVGAPYRFPDPGRPVGAVPSSRERPRTLRIRSRIVREPAGPPPKPGDRLQSVLKRIVRAAIHSTDPQVKQWAVEILDAMEERPPW